MGVLAVIITFYYTQFMASRTRATWTFNVMKKHKHDSDPVVSLYEHFLVEPTPRKITILSLLLTVAAFEEEIIYRYFIINLLAIFPVFWGSPPLPSAITIIIISAVIFGFAHRQNGNVIYVINSMLGGVVFAWFFMVYGIMGGFILHLVWNAIVIVQQWIAIKYSNR